MIKQIFFLSFIVLEETDTTHLSMKKKKKKTESLLLLLTIMASVHCVIMMFNIRYKLYAAEFRLARKYTKL